jgi:hypothetical protein
MLPIKQSDKVENREAIRRQTRDSAAGSPDAIRTTVGTDRIRPEPAEEKSRDLNQKIKSRSKELEAIHE